MPIKIQLWVPGVPQPKGSTRSFVVNGKAITTSTVRGLKDWEQSIRYVVAVNKLVPIHGPVKISLTFLLPRPASRHSKPHSKDPWKRDPVPDTKPDLDKLIRGCLDPLGGGIVIDDDSRVLEIQATKRYVDSDGQPGVLLVVEEIPPETSTTVS